MAFLSGEIGLCLVTNFSRNTPPLSTLTQTQLSTVTPKLSVSDFVGTLKSNSSKHINDTSELLRKFGWQDGFGAFTVSVSQKNRVIQYIEKQMAHHAGHSFEDEYLDLLKKHEVEYDPRYVWD